MNIEATAEWSDGWWAIVITMPDGTVQATQARRLDKVGYMVKDAVSLLLEIDSDTIEVHTRYLLPTDLSDALAAIDAAHLAAEQAKAAEVKARRDAAAAIRARNITMRDIGALMGVSHQRAHQLLSDAT